jgi:sugar phosphate permease
VGKLLAGPVADTVSPSRLLVATMAVSAAANAAMFATGSHWMDLSLWGLNGLAQVGRGGGGGGGGAGGGGGGAELRGVRVWS